jgi:hypothetical protein
VSPLLFAVVDAVFEGAWLRAQVAVFATRAGRNVAARETAKARLGAWRALWAAPC